MTMSRRGVSKLRCVLPVALAAAVSALSACSTSDARTSATRTTGAPSEASTPSDVALERQWVAPGPRNPQAIAADERGVVSVGRYGPAVACDARGRVQWRQELAEEGEQTLGPIALNRSVVVTSVVPAEGPERIVAIDRVTGEARWSAIAGDRAKLGVGRDRTSPIAVLSATGLLALLDGRSGSSLWSVQLPFREGAGPMSVAVRAHRVVAAWGDVDGGHLQGFDVDTGREVWSKVHRWFFGTPAVTDDAVVLNENLDRHGRTARIERLDLSTGARIWAHDVSGPFLVLTAVAVDREVAATVDVGGTLTVLDLADGSLRWRQPTRRMQYAATPLIVGSTVAMTTYGTGLVALATADGRAVPNDEPGPVQLEVTFESSASAGNDLYLLAGRSGGAGEIWMLS